MNQNGTEPTQPIPRKRGNYCEYKRNPNVPYTEYAQRQWKRIFQDNVKPKNAEVYTGDEIVNHDEPSCVTPSLSGTYSTEDPIVPISADLDGTNVEEDLSACRQICSQLNTKDSCDDSNVSCDSRSKALVLYQIDLATTCPKKSSSTPLDSCCNDSEEQSFISPTLYSSSHVDELDGQTLHVPSPSSSSLPHAHLQCCDNPRGMPCSKFHLSCSSSSFGQQASSSLRNSPAITHINNVITQECFEEIFSLEQDSPDLECFGCIDKGEVTEPNLAEELEQSFDDPGGEDNAFGFFPSDRAEKFPTDDYDDSRFPDDLYSSDDELYDFEGSKSTSFESLRDKILRNEKLFEEIETQNTVTQAGLLRMILQYSFRNNLSFTGIVDLARLMNISLGSQILPDTRYLFDKLCNADIDYTLHAVCPNCTEYLGEFDDKKIKHCDNCNRDNDVSKRSNPCYFVIIDPSQAVRDYLETYEDYYDDVVHGRLHETGHIKDIHDAQMYLDFRDSLPDSERTSYGTFSMNADGVEAFEKSKTSITPIYLMINELPPSVRLKSLILVGLYVGVKKPPWHVFLEKFVDAMNKLSERGIECIIKNQKRVIRMYILVSPVDTMARFYMNGTCVFHSIFGCDWCLHPGVRFAGSRRFPYIDPPPLPRDIENYVLFAEEALLTGMASHGVKLASALLNLLKFHIIYGFVPEYMHQSLAGVVKQLLSEILNSLTPAHRELMDFYLKKARAPALIGKLSKELKSLPTWKCKDFENFALYYSIPVFSAVIEDETLLKHWALLVDSLHVGLGMDITVDEINDSNIKLHMFVRDIEEVYTLKEATYNVHQSTHLMKSVYDWGPLWAHSAFPFETWNMKLVNSIHSEKGIILQVLRAMNLRRFEQILQKIMGPRADETVESYCQRLKRPRSDNVVIVEGNSYLGKSHSVDAHMSAKFNVKSSMIRFARCIISGCLYMNDKKENARSCNYFAQLKDGRYIKILHFLVEIQDKEQLTVCRIIDVVRNRLSETVMEMKGFLIGEFVIPTTDITRICVQVDIDNLRYITPVPNILHY